jgi:hypothetical protein
VRFIPVDLGCPNRAICNRILATPFRLRHRAPLYDLGRERLMRYGARPMLALDRLRRLAGGPSRARRKLVSTEIARKIQAYRSDLASAPGGGSRSVRLDRLHRGTAALLVELGDAQVVDLLKIEPDLRSGLERSGETERRVGSD